MQRTLAFLIVFILSFPAIAEEQTIDNKKHIAWDKYQTFSITGAESKEDAMTPWSVTSASLNQKSLRDCPSGFEKLREYTTREGDKYFLHFVVRCITPATLSATVPSAPK